MSRIIPIEAILPILLLAAPAHGICFGIWSKLTPASHPLAREYTAMVYDSDRGLTILFGGDLGSSNIGDTWEWDNVNWGNKSQVVSPSARALHAMAYDASRHVTVLFGGDFKNDTWEWSGSAWTQRTPTSSPTGRLAHAMTYDSDRRVVVLFGGAVPIGFGLAVNDTWEYDGTTWTQKLPTISPPLLLEHSLVYDPIRRRTVLFGGTADSMSYSSDTWLYDGTTWTHATPAQSPPPRGYHRMVFDSNKGVAVLFGGSDSHNLLSDTWNWDGTNWSEEAALVSPAGRAGFGMAYDIVHSQTVVFGGQVLSNGASAPTDETWSWTSPEPLITQQPADLALSPGQTATFSVTAVGQGFSLNPPPLTFQWRKNGKALSDGGNVSGSLTGTLSINPSGPGDAGQYDCVVTNCGQTISRAGTLDPCKPLNAADDCDGNGVADACDLARDPSLDSDSNGIIDSCQTASTGTSADNPQTTPSGQTTPDSQNSMPNAQAPCGACGGGAATMAPLSLLALDVARRRRLVGSGRRFRVESRT